MATRREFLKGLTATSATALLGPGLLAAGLRTGEASVSAEGAWKTTGSHWGAIRAWGKGGKVVLSVDGRQFATGRVKATQGYRISLD